MKHSGIAGGFNLGGIGSGIGAPIGLGGQQNDPNMQEMN